MQTKVSMTELIIFQSYIISRICEKESCEMICSVGVMNWWTSSHLLLEIRPTLSDLLKAIGAMSSHFFLPNRSNVYSQCLIAFAELSVYHCLCNISWCNFINSLWEKKSMLRFKFLSVSSDLSMLCKLPKHYLVVPPYKIIVFHVTFFYFHTPQ